MALSHSSRATVVIAATLLAAAPQAFPDVRVEVDKLFQVGWSTSYKTRAAADAQFQAVKQSAAGRLEAYYAYALVLIKQRRYQPASKLVAQLAREDPENIHYLRAKAWLESLSKSYEASLLTLEQLSERVVRIDESDSLQRNEMVAFLGRMLGFLEGPAGASANSGAVAAAKARIVARLTTDEAQRLEQSRRRVLAEHQSLTAESESAEEEALAEAADQRDRVLADLELQRERMKERRDELSPKREKLRDEAKAELAQFAKEEAPLLQQLAQLEQQALVVRRELLLLSDDITRMQSRAERERDAVVRASLINEASRLSFLARRYDVDLLALERRAASINQQRAEIRSRARQAQQRLAAEFGQIDTELADLHKQQRRNELQERKGQRSRVTGKSRLTRALAAKASALGTYEEFPLEAEKRRVLEALK